MLLGDDGELGEVVPFLFDPVVPPAPDELLELPVLAPVPPVSAGRSQPARSAPDRAKESARARVRASVVIERLLSGQEPSNKQTDPLSAGLVDVTVSDP